MLIRDSLEVGEPRCSGFRPSVITHFNTAVIDLSFRRNLPSPSLVYFLYGDDGGSWFPETSVFLKLHGRHITGNYS